MESSECLRQLDQTSSCDLFQNQHFKKFVEYVLGHFQIAICYNHTQETNDLTILSDPLKSESTT